MISYHIYQKNTNQTFIRHKNNGFKKNKPIVELTIRKDLFMIIKNEELTSFKDVFH